MVSILLIIVVSAVFISSSVFTNIAAAQTIKATVMCAKQNLVVRWLRSYCKRLPSAHLHIQLPHNTPLAHQNTLNVFTHIMFCCRYWLHIIIASKLMHSAAVCMFIVGLLHTLDMHAATGVPIARVSPPTIGCRLLGTRRQICTLRLGGRCNRQPGAQETADC